MSSRRKRNKKNTERPIISRRDVLWYEVLGVFIFSSAVLLAIALFSYDRQDPAWSTVSSVTEIHNRVGPLGAFLSDIILYWLGFVGYILPFYAVMVAWRLVMRPIRERQADESAKGRSDWKVFSLILVLLSSTGLLFLYVKPVSSHLPFESGGILGILVGTHLLKVAHSVGAVLILVTGLLVGTMGLLRLSWMMLLELTGQLILKLGKSLIWLVMFCPWSKLWNGLIQSCREVLFAIGRYLGRAFVRKKWSSPSVERVIAAPKKTTLIKSPQTVSSSDPLLAYSVTAVDAGNEEESVFEPVVKRSTPVTVEQLALSAASKDIPRPALSLLQSPKQSSKSSGDLQKFMMEKAREVESRLQDFGVEVKVVGVYPGPVVTRYELELAAGTKVSKISNLSKDLARSLSVVSVRVVEVIPGKSYIGLELPNANRQTVTLQEVLASSSYEKTRAALPLALGKDIAGNPVVVDLAKMPHLLVAGTTGSGKSVGLNAMLLSLMYQAPPDVLRLILIDPKMLELSVYEGVPHLLTPVVTDMKDAALALRWCVGEMERRYRLMAAVGVRNLAGYNFKVKEAEEKGKPLRDPLQPGNESAAFLQPMPRIVVLADEFADMMVVVGKKVETLIARLAQKARAAGIHLILATQRPSVDVITGLIKANIPTRIAFQVSSKIDSRTILDQSGAEQLLGNGDMLYLPPGAGVPIRVHGAFVDDAEVHRVVGFLKKAGKPTYVDDLLDSASAAHNPHAMSQSSLDFDDGEQDSLYDEAVAIVVKERRVSISSIQRRFKIGYNRAARIVETMEAAGVVGPMESNGSREVLRQEERR